LGYFSDSITSNSVISLLAHLDAVHDD